jgi:hypothetical protein
MSGVYYVKSQLSSATHISYNLMSFGRLISMKYKLHRKTCHYDEFACCEKKQRKRAQTQNKHILKQGIVTENIFFKECRTNKMKILDKKIMLVLIMA